MDAQLCTGMVGRKQSEIQRSTSVDFPPARSIFMSSWHHDIRDFDSEIGSHSRFFYYFIYSFVF